MSDTELRQFISVIQRLPVDIFESESLRTFWINGFADVDELVQDYFTLLKDSEDYKDLPTVIEDACRATEKLLEYYANHAEGRKKENSERNVTDDPTLWSETSSTFNDSLGSGPWSALSKCNISQQSVLAFLFVFLQSECNSSVPDSDRHLCLLSARFYLDLLCLPGCGAYGIFHYAIFQNAISCMGLKETEQDEGRSKQHVKPNKGRKKTKGKNANRPNLPESDEEMEVANDDEAETNTQISKKSNVPVNVQKKLILEILFSLENVLRTVPLKRHIGMVVKELVDITTWDTEFNLPALNFDPDGHAPRGQTRDVGSQALRNLVVLCNPIHGELHLTFCNIFAYLLPIVIMTGAGNAQNIPRNVVTLKDNATELAVYLIKKFSPGVLPSAKILVKHSCTKLVDRAEFRTRIAESVLSFVRNFPVEDKKEIIDWFLILNKSSKTSHRMFSLEVLSSLSTELESIGTSVASLIKAIVERINDKSSVVSSKAMSLLSSSHDLLTYVLDETNPDVDQKVFFEMVIESCLYEKSAVRKAAVQLLESLICHNKNCMTEKNLKAITDRAQDVNVSVQKQSCISMTKILETYPESDQAQNAWLTTQLPLVCADESSVQEKSMEMIENMIIRQVLKDTELSWLLLAKVSDGMHQDKQQYLRRAFSIWLRQNNGTPKDFIRCIRGRMNTHYKQPAWMVLTFLTVGNKLTNLNFVVDSFLDEMRQENSIDVNVLKLILQVVSQTSSSIPKDDVKQLLKELTIGCKEFKIPVQVIPSAFQAIEKIMAEIYDDKQKEEWCSSLFQEVNRIFSTSMILKEGYKPDVSTPDEENLVRCIITVGDVFQLRPWLLPSKFKLVIHSLIGRPLISQQAVPLDAFPFSTPPEPGSVSARIKAHAIITWGKLCIGDMDFCKTSLLTAIKELQESTEPSIRNNIAVALSDLLIFHPNLTEPYISNVTACLQDKYELVRRQTLLVLARLLKEDYIKWKGTLFYRVLLCYVDDSREIMKMAEYCLLQLLLKRQPHAFSHHFVECIYYLNNYTKNEAINQFPGEQSQPEKFSLRNKPEKRFTLYQFLLRNMPDQERFHLHSQLCQDVLNPLMDGVFPLNEDSSEVIKDTLCVLSCEEIKLTPLAGLHEDEDEEEAAVRADAKKVITALIRKQVVQSVLPVIVSLKAFLENAHSPLICYLEKFFKEFLKDFKNELKDILGEDKRLAAEIAFIVNSA